MQNLTIKSTHKYSIITIVNWAKYQEEVTHKVTQYQPSTNPVLTTDKKGKKGKKEKNIYGEFKNVLLADDEYQKLKDRFNNNTDSLIENLSSYIASKGVKYSSHYATILSWEQKNRKDSPQGKVYKNL